MFGKSPSRQWPVQVTGSRLLPPLREGTIPGDGFNPIWEEVQITFNSGFTPVQFTSDTAVLAAAASGEITLTDTEEFYRCSVVGPK